MPCWFYDKKDLVNTPSYRDGISPETEAWYRKEGAKHIMDAGNKLGLRFDTCATGVVYFHRFYMFHSFKEFHRLVTAACCLFLAGKVEETPKKCKDIIKTFRSMLNDAQFAHFGEDAKEEVMTLERILLQTIKFDLMVEHPYAYLLKFAKLVKGDKAKIQKMVQMAWTFINDSLCTTLCLQWEPEIVAVAVMYLTSRLNKFEITDWQGRPLGYRGKWYEFLVEDVTLELLEDICHQVLDLYSNAPQPQKDVASSPVPVKVRQPQISSDDDQSRTPRTPKSPHGVKRPAPSAAASAGASVPGSSQQTEADVMPPAAKDRERLTTHTESVSASSRAASTHSVPPMTSALPTAASAATAAVPMVGAPVTSFSNANPYMPSQMYSSSFMSTEGSQSIQSLMGTEAGAAASREEQGQASQGRYPNTGSVAYQQQYPGLNVAQQYPSAPSNQSSSGSSAGAHRSDYSSSSGAASASGSYRAAAVGGYQTGSQSSTPFSQQQYTSYQQPPPSMQSFPESGSASYGGPAYSSGVSQSQYPSASTGSSQSSSPLYQNFGGTRSAAPPFGSQGTTVAAQQQQRYQPSNQSVPIGNSGFQAAGGAGFQSQLSSSTGFQNQQGSSSASYSSGGYPGRTGASAGYSAEQPSSSSGSFHQSSQQSYSGREQLSGNNYQGQQPGYQQPPGNIRSSGQGGQQQGSSSNRGQNWSY